MRFVSTVLVVFTLSVPLYGQANTDSLEALLLSVEGRERISVLTALVNAQAAIDPTQALQYAGEAQALLRRSPIKNLEADLLNGYAEAHYKQGAYDSVLVYAERLGSIGRSIGQPTLLADADFHVGRVAYRKRDGEALSLLHQALEVYEAEGNPKDIAKTHLIIGNVYYYTDSNRAITSYKTALTHAEVAGERLLIAQALNNIGLMLRRTAETVEAQEEALANYLYAARIKLELGDKQGAIRSLYSTIDLQRWLDRPDAVLEAAHSVVELGAELAQPSILVANAHRSMAEVNWAREKHDLAEEQYEEALKTYAAIGDGEQNMALVHTDLGGLHTSMGEENKALHDYRQALLIREKLDNTPYLASALRNMGDAEALVGNREAALSTYERAIALLEDALLEDLEDDEAEPLQVELSSVRANMVSQQQQLIVSLNQAAQIQRLWVTLLVGGVVLIGVIAVLLQGRYRSSQRAREEIARSHNEIQQAHQKLTATQQQLILAEKMASLGQLTAGIAHEIKNPLNFVNNFAEVNAELADELREALAEGEDPSELLDDLKQNALVIAQHGKRADGIVHAMMQHASGGTGQREATDINALVSDHIDLAYQGKRAQNAELQVEIERDLADDVGNVELIPQDIGRVLLNLLSNAFDAVQGMDNPKVTVTTRRGDGHVEIRVADNGPGIPVDIKDRIFEPFFTTKPTGTGTGLGLSLSYDIVTQGHGGTLTVESIEGKGAAFIVTLPA